MTVSHGREDKRREGRLYSRNGKVISDSYIEVAKALEGARGDAVVDGELVALTRMGSRIFSCCRTRSAIRRSFSTVHSTLCSTMGRTCEGSRFWNARIG